MSSFGLPVVSGSHFRAWWLTCSQGRTRVTRSCKPTTVVRELVHVDLVPVPGVHTLLGTFATGFTPPLPVPLPRVAI